MRIKITIEYDGKNFCGWQIQPEQRSVQGVLQDAFEKLLGEKTLIQASGRTDAGVHASGQVAHLDVNTPFPVEKIPLAINVLLPPDVSVLSAKKVNNDFEARFSAKKKTYRYDFYLSKAHRPLLSQYSARVPYSPDKFDVKKAQSALEKLVGEHDFIAFSSTGRPVSSGVRTIYSAKIEKLGEIYSITVTGNGFLYNMVRIIAGTVIEIGLNLLPEKNIDLAFKTGDRTLLGKTYPPQGLTLVSVEYR